jgi:hypothetical protein
MPVREKIQALLRKRLEEEKMVEIFIELNINGEYCHGCKFIDTDKDRRIICTCFKYCLEKRGNKRLPECLRAEKEAMLRGKKINFEQLKKVNDLVEKLSIVKDAMDLKTISVNARMGNILISDEELKTVLVARKERLIEELKELGYEDE